VQYFGELGADIDVFRNDKITINKIARLKPKKIVISPGPGRPEDAGISCEVIRVFAGKITILGVCLGHQAIGYVYGGRIIGAKKLMHGKIVQIKLNGNDKYGGRFLTNVLVDEVSLADILIKSGHARAYYGDKKISFEEWYDAKKLRDVMTVHAELKALQK